MSRIKVLRELKLVTMPVEYKEYQKDLAKLSENKLIAVVKMSILGLPLIACIHISRYLKLTGNPEIDERLILAFQQGYGYGANKNRSNYNDLHKSHSLFVKRTDELLTSIHQSKTIINMDLIYKAAKNLQEYICNGKI